VALGIFILNKNISFTAAVFSICFAYLLIFIFITVDIRKYLSFHLDKFWADKFFRYGIYALVGNICFAILPIFSKLLVNKYLTTFDVGIYNAYYFSSIGIIIFLLDTFITVFFPTVSKYQNKESIFRKIRQLMPYLIFLGFFIIFVSEWIFLNLYGAKYPINYFLMLPFSLSSILIAIYSIYSWLFLSEGIRGIKLVALSAVLVAFINIFMSFYFIPTFALYGAIISLGIAYFVGITCLFFLEKKILLV
jgi:O-antigen/teichoic acid export membrane protein